MAQRGHFWQIEPDGSSDFTTIFYHFQLQPACLSREALQIFPYFNFVILPEYKSATTLIKAANII